MIGLLSSCNLFQLTYHISSANYNFKDSLNLSDHYEIYVRKLVFDSSSNSAFINNAKVPASGQKIIEMDYLLFNPDSGQAILISYLPSYYYPNNPKEKGGIYTQIEDDEVIYLHQVRRILFMEPTQDSQTLSMGRYYLQYDLKEDHGKFELLKAKKGEHDYQNGIIHIRETVKNNMEFDRRSYLDIRRFIPPANINSVSQRKQLSILKYNQSNYNNLYILDEGKRKGIVFKIPNSDDKIKFGKKRTNYFNNRHLQKVAIPANMWD